jgi:hypothetical protein
MEVAQEDLDYDKEYREMFEDKKIQEIIRKEEIEQKKGNMKIITSKYQSLPNILIKMTCCCNKAISKLQMNFITEYASHFIK